MEAVNFWHRENPPTWAGVESANLSIQGHKTIKTSDNINQTFDQETIGEHAVQHQYQKFQIGDEDYENFSVVYDNQLVEEGIISLDACKITEKVTK
ncbi:hypothetical protein TNCV_2284581 [Trichonephila clavipes]|nr:hypothetical protein TNCV_2284581 [Trichonephila clavipes]